VPPPPLLRPRDAPGSGSCSWPNAATASGPTIGRGWWVSVSLQIHHRTRNSTVALWCGAWFNRCWFSGARHSSVVRLCWRPSLATGMSQRSIAAPIAGPIPASTSGTAIASMRRAFSRYENASGILSSTPGQERRGPSVIVLRRSVTKRPGTPTSPAARSTRHRLPMALRNPQRPSRPTPQPRTATTPNSSEARRSRWSTSSQTGRCSPAPGPSSVPMRTSGG
jgi:hypothetical protein